MFCIKVSIKDKRAKVKESIPFSLLLSLSKHKVLELVCRKNHVSFAELLRSYTSAETCTISQTGYATKTCLIKCIS